MRDGSVRGQGIMLEERPYQRGRVQIGCVALVANHEMARPLMAHTANLIMYDGDMIATSRPFFADNVVLIEENGWPNGTAITLDPLLEPERNRGVAFANGTLIGNNSVACAMNLKERYRPCRLATAWYSGIRAGDRSKSGEASGEFASQQIGHTSTIRETSCEYFAGIDTQC